MTRSLFALLAVVLLTSTAGAQNANGRRREISGDRLGGFVLPVEPRDGDITFRALRGDSWTVDETKRLRLDGDVRIEIGSFTFDCEQAVVWLNRLPSAGGVINQVVLYLDEVQNSSQQAGMGVTGRRVLVTASARGSVRLNVVALDQRRPRRDRLVETGEDRLADHLRHIVAGDVPLQSMPIIAGAGAERPVRAAPKPGGSTRLETVDLPQYVELPPDPSDVLPIIVPQGSVRFTFGEATLTTGTDEDVLTAGGGVIADYLSNEPDERWSQITMSAQRMVVFLDPGMLRGAVASEVGAENIRGVYLEGDVVITTNRDEYTVRAPQVYYDFVNDRALMLQAVLRTYDDRTGRPIYARARELRQVAANEWSGEQARVSTSEFFTPHLAIGADRFTVTSDPDANDDRSGTTVQSRGNTLRIADVPIFYWPKFDGQVNAIPMREIQLSSGDNNGVAVETRWDTFTLLGYDPPPNTSSTMQIDVFTDRGLGLGNVLDYSVDRGIGRLDTYLMYDTGTDRTSAGREVDPGDGFRGVALWEHRAALTPEWTLDAQISYISDPTFITARREDDFRNRREYETGAMLRWQRHNAAFLAGTTYSLNDFISNDYLLASRQYTVDRLPELQYHRYGDAWFDDAVSYSSQTRLGRVRFRLDQDTPRELGVRGRAFGLDEDDRISDALRAAGYPEKTVTRFDSRHELAMPMDWGIIRAVPFGTLRYTSYDDGFDDFSSDADSARVFASAGLHLSTEFHHIDDRASSRVFNINRIRHIIEPSLTMWYGYSDVPLGSLPVYDQSVEAIGGGSVVAMAVRNTWQTQRGGPGRWRSVDFLVLDTGIVLHSDDVNRASPVPQYFDFRPENSQFGDHAYGKLLWQASDAVAFIARSTFDLDESTFARGSIGTRIEHAPSMTSYLEYRFVDVADSEILAAGFAYDLTPKYRVVIAPDWDFRNDEFRRVVFRVQREFPDFDVNIGVGYDQIKDETVFSASVRQHTF